MLQIAYEKVLGVLQLKDHLKKKKSNLIRANYSKVWNEKLRFLSSNLPVCLVEVLQKFLYHNKVFGKPIRGAYLCHFLKKKIAYESPSLEIQYGTQL